MARTVKDASLQSREARGRLKPSGAPYYRALEEGLHLGYRKPKAGAGKWVLRHYVGVKRTRSGKDLPSYAVETIGTTDDLSDADGVAVLNWKQAQAHARERMVQRAHAAAGKTGPLTVADVIADYLEFLETKRKSARDARYRANALILPKLGNVEASTLTTDQLSKWHADLAKAPARVRTSPGDKQRYKPAGKDDESKRRRQATANRTLTILKAALNRAWRTGKLPSDAAWRRVEPFEDVDRARMRYLTIDECRRLINAADPDFRQLVQAALQTGARYGELAQLTVADFNPDAGTLAIRQSKTGKPRYVTLTDEGMELFAGLCAGRASDEIMLRRAPGGQWLKSNQNLPMAAACSRAKITPPIGVHGLRHTWASHAVMNGVPLLVVAKNLGHADTRMVEKHYGHLAPSYIADAIRAGAPRFGTVEPSNVLPIKHKLPAHRVES